MSSTRRGHFETQDLVRLDRAMRHAVAELGDDVDCAALRRAVARRLFNAYATGKTKDDELRSVAVDAARRFSWTAEMLKVRECVSAFGCL
jgi:hypothetical protein